MVIPVPNKKLNALVTYITKAVTSRGFVDEEDLQTFIDAGYSKQNVLEVNLILALKQSVTIPLIWQVRHSMKPLRGNGWNFRRLSFYSDRRG